MFRKFANIILGVFLLSTTQLGNNIWVKTVCVDGYEFVITYATYYHDGDASKNDPLNLKQIYEEIQPSGLTVPKKCSAPQVKPKTPAGGIK